MNLVEAAYPTDGTIWNDPDEGGPLTEKAMSSAELAAQRVRGRERQLVCLPRSQGVLSDDQIRAVPRSGQDTRVAVQVEYALQNLPVIRDTVAVERSVGD